MYKIYACRIRNVCFSPDGFFPEKAHRFFNYTVIFKKLKSAGCSHNEADSYPAAGFVFSCT